MARGASVLRLGLSGLKQAPFEHWLDRTLTTLPGATDTVSDATVANRSPANDALGSETKQRYKALVIDPDELRRILAADALMAFEPGFDVVTVPDLGEASEWIESFVPDLLVMSENMAVSYTHLTLPTIYTV